MTPRRLFLLLCENVANWDFQPLHCVSVNVVYHDLPSLLSVCGICAHSHRMPSGKTGNPLYPLWNGLVSAPAQVWMPLRPKLVKL